jgi:hypothetical protein
MLEAPDGDEAMRYVIFWQLMIKFAAISKRSNSMELSSYAQYRAQKAVRVLNDVLIRQTIRLWEEAIRANYRN